MPTELSPTQRLADHILGRPLVEYVREKRETRPRWSWQLIADQLSEDTNGELVLSRETLRQWFGGVS